METNNNAANTPEPAEINNGADAVQPTATNEGEKKAISYEAFEALQKSVNSLAAHIRRSQEQPEKPAKKETERSIEERLKAVEIREAQAAKKTRDANIKQTISALGVPADRAEFLFDHLELKHSANIIEDGSKYKEIHEDGSSRETPLSDWMKTFVSSTSGEMFRPPVSTPQGKGLKTSGSAPMSRTTYTQLSQEERLKLSPAQAMELVRQEMGYQTKV